MSDILSEILATGQPSIVLQSAGESSGMDREQLGTFVNDITERLHNLGLGRNHKIGLALSEGVPSTTTALLASVNTSIAVALRRFENEEMIGVSLETSSPDVLILDDKVPNYEEIIAVANRKKIPVISLHPLEGKPGEFTLLPLEGFHNLEAGDMSEPSEDDVAVLFLTSGTTGEPKLVAHTHGNFLHNARSHLNTLGIDEDLRCLHVLSQRAQWGVTSAITTLLSGGTLMLYPHPELDDNTLVDLIGDSRPNWLPVPPPILAGLCQLARRDSAVAHMLNKSSLRVVQTSSSPSSPKLLHQVQAMLPQINILQTFGATETGPIAANTSTNNLLGTVGKPVAGVEIRVVDGNGDVVKTGQMGELWVRSPSLARYYDNEIANRKSFTKDGFYKTGDMIRLNVEGCITILGRKSEFFTSHGREILPSAIDLDLAFIKGIKAVVSFPVQDPEAEDNGVGVIIVPEKDIDSAAAVKMIEQRIEWRPDTVFLMDEIPERFMTSKATPRRNVISEELGSIGEAGVIDLRSKQKPQIVFFTGSPEGVISGVGDYTRNQASELKKLGYDVIVLDEESWDLSGNGSLQRQLRSLNPDNKMQILHVQYPGLQSQDWQLLDQLQSLKIQGNQKLVMTFHQFSILKSGINPGSPSPGFSLRYKDDTLPFLQKADQVVFTTEEERASAVEFSASYSLDLARKSRVIQIPGNIPGLDPIPERTNHIATFARLFPERRGFEDIITMAACIRELTTPQDAPERQNCPDMLSYDPDQEKLTVHIIGDIVETGEGSGKLVTNFFKNDIIKRIYRLSEQELTMLDELEDKKDILEFIAGKTKRIDIELHIGESPERVAELIGQAGFMLTLVKGGVSARNGSVIPGMQMERITIATKGKNTPSSYQQGGVVFVENWQDALQQINHMQKTGRSLQTPQNKVAFGLDEIGARAREATMQLTPENIVKAHDDLYIKLSRKERAVIVNDRHRRLSFLFHAGAQVLAPTCRRHGVLSLRAVPARKTSFRTIQP